MESDAQAHQKQKRFESLMQAGKAAYREGDRRLAHDLWREAATLDPYSEKVWLALYRVLQTDEDRAVCLKNIIAINPMNVQARRRLNALEQEAEAAPAPKEKGRAASKAKTRTTAARVRRSPPKPQVQPSERSGKSLRRALLIGVLAGASGVLGGLLISVLLYGR